MSEKKPNLPEKDKRKESPEMSEEASDKKNDSQLSTAQTKNPTVFVRSPIAAAKMTPTKKVLDLTKGSKQDDQKKTVVKGTLVLDNKNSKLGKRSKVKTGEDPSDDDDSDGEGSGDEEGEEEQDEELSEDEDQEGVQDRTQEIADKAKSKKKPKQGKRQFITVDEKPEDQARPEASKNKEDSSSYKLPPPPARKEDRRTRRLRRESSNPEGGEPQEENQQQEEQEPEYPEIELYKNVMQYTDTIGNSAQAIKDQLDIFKMNRTFVNQDFKDREKIIDDMKTKVEPFLQEGEGKKLLEEMTTGLKNILNKYKSENELVQQDYDQINMHLESIKRSSAMIGSEFRRRVSGNAELKQELLKNMEESAVACGFKIYRGSSTKAARVKFYTNFGEFLLFCATWAKLYADVFARDPIFCKPCHTFLFGSTDKNRQDEEFHIKMFVLRDVINLYRVDSHERAEELFINLLYHGNDKVAREDYRRTYEKLWMPFFLVPGSEESGKAIYHKCNEEKVADLRPASSIQSKDSGSAKKKTSSKHSPVTGRPAEATHAMETRSAGHSSKKSAKGGQTINVVKKSATPTEAKPPVQPSKPSGAAPRRGSPPPRQPAMPPAPVAREQLTTNPVEDGIEIFMAANRFITKVELKSYDGMPITEFQAATIGSVVLHTRPAPQPPN